MDVFAAASVGLALATELAEPLPMTDTSRSEVVDAVYDALTADPETSDDRRTRMSRVLQAGGEVR